MLYQVIMIATLALVGNHVLNLMRSQGYFTVIYKQHPGPCRTVPGIEKGAEDVTVASNGLAFISSEINCREASDPSRLPPNIRGKIFLFDFNYPEKNVIELPLIGDFNRDMFYPHGISLYEDPKSGEKRLFVISHPEHGDERIEIFSFDQESKSLNHLKTVKGENMYSVNDIVAVGPDSFYYTNDIYVVHSKLLKHVEIYGNFAWGNVGFYDGKHDTIVKSGFRFANGINVSPDGRYLYVAALLARQVTVFEIKTDHTLEEKQIIDLYTGVDNIEVDRKTGDLWIGAHPAPHIYLSGHALNATLPTPSHVLKVHFGSKSAPYDNVEVTQVFMDDGSFLKGSSAACYYDNKMLIGTVLDKLGFCEIKAF